MNNTNDLIDRFKHSGLIPICNLQDLDESIQIIETCYQEGINVFEFQHKTDDENTFKVFRELNTFKSKYPDLKLGVGTILSKEVALKFIELKADFIASPFYIASIADQLKESNKLYIPGASTIAEVDKVYRSGFSFIKIFCGNSYCSEFVKTIKIIYPKMKLMVGGYISPDLKLLKDWFALGTHCVGIGAGFFEKPLLEQKKKLVLKRMLKDSKEIKRISM